MRSKSCPRTAGSRPSPWVGGGCRSSPRLVAPFIAPQVLECLFGSTWAAAWNLVIVAELVRLTRARQTDQPGPTLSCAPMKSCGADRAWTDRLLIDLGLSLLMRPTCRLGDLMHLLLKAFQQIVRQGSATSNSWLETNQSRVTPANSWRFVGRFRFLGKSTVMRLIAGLEQPRAAPCHMERIARCADPAGIGAWFFQKYSLIPAECCRQRAFRMRAAGAKQTA